MLYISRPHDKIQAKCPTEWGFIVTKAFDFLTRCNVEYNGTIFLDKDDYVLEISIDSEGVSDSVQVNAWEIFRRAEAIGASHIVCFHNHVPGTNSLPSKSDISTFKHVKLMISEYNIKCLDSLVICALGQCANGIHNVFGTVFSINSWKEFYYKKRWQKDLKELRRRNYKFIYIKSPKEGFANTLGIYDKWEKESAKPVKFSKFAKTYNSIYTELNDINKPDCIDKFRKWINGSILPGRKVN